MFTKLFKRHTRISWQPILNNVLLNFHKHENKENASYPILSASNVIRNTTFAKESLPALEKISHSKWVQQLFPSCIWSLPSEGEKIIYLTFDDGPVEEITPWVLETLNKYQAKATFFCVGENVERNPSLYQKIISSGHSVGNHTYSHKNGWKTLYSDYIKDVSEGEKYITSDLFRPPYGKLKPLQIKALKKKFQIIMWSFITGDYLKTLNKELVLEEMKNKINSGDIVVFHDSVKAEKNLKFLLPEVLQFYSSLGYRFKSIQQLKAGTY